MIVVIVIVPRKSKVLGLRLEFDNKNNQITLMGCDTNEIDLLLISFDNNLSLDVLIN